MIVGITGSIGSGKSTVSQILRDAGYLVLNADEISRQLMEPGQPGYLAVAKEFPSSLIQQNGLIDRQALANLIFRHPNEKQRLEQILHPMVKNELQRQSEGQKLVFWEVPLLFESGFDHVCDRTLCVVAEDKLLIERVMQRSLLTQKQVEERLQTQFSQHTKMQLADDTIANDETLEDLKEAVHHWLAGVLKHEREDDHVVSRK